MQKPKKPGQRGTKWILPHIFGGDKKVTYDVLPLLPVLNIREGHQWSLIIVPTPEHQKHEPTAKMRLKVWTSHVIFEYH